MLTNQANVIINQPIEKVFSYVIQFGNKPRWCQGTLESRQTSKGAVGVGATFHEVFELFLGRKGEADYKITEFEPNKRLVFVSTSGLVQSKETMTFETVAANTRITQITDAEFGRFKIVEPLFKGMGGRMLLGNLARLKNELER
jgi:uncharacterized protein YndB with AHSA1/START domain